MAENNSFDVRDLGQSIKDSPLETIILRDCTSLKEVKDHQPIEGFWLFCSITHSLNLLTLQKEVLQFLNSLLTGKLRFIQNIVSML